MLGASFTTGQASIGTTAALLVPERFSRRQLRVRNTHATQTLYIGASDTVTVSTGHAIPAGTDAPLDTKHTVYAIASGAATTTTFMEAFD